jgi:hypothetical protein
MAVRFQFAILQFENTFRKLSLHFELIEDPFSCATRQSFLLYKTLEIETPLKMTTSQFHQLVI